MQTMSYILVNCCYDCIYIHIMNVLRVWLVLPICYATFENIYYSIPMQCIHIGLVAYNGPSVA